MIHARIVNVERERSTPPRSRVLVACACETWAVDLPARSGVLELAAEKFREHATGATFGPTISPKRTRSRNGEQETGTVAHAVPVSDHHKEGTPAVHAEVPVMSPRTGSEAR